MNPKKWVQFLASHWSQRNNEIFLAFHLGPLQPRIGEQGSLFSRACSFSLDFWTFPLSHSSRLLPSPVETSESQLLRVGVESKPLSTLGSWSDGPGGTSRWTATEAGRSRKANQGRGDGWVACTQGKGSTSAQESVYCREDWKLLPCPPALAKLLSCTRRDFLHLHNAGSTQSASLKAYVQPRHHIVTL